MQIREKIWAHFHMKKAMPSSTTNELLSTPSKDKSHAVGTVFFDNLMKNSQRHIHKDSHTFLSWFNSHNYDQPLMYLAQRHQLIVVVDREHRRSAVVVLGGGQGEQEGQCSCSDNTLICSRLFISGRLASLGLIIFSAKPLSFLVHRSLNVTQSNLKLEGKIQCCTWLKKVYNYSPQCNHAHKQAAKLFLQWTEKTFPPYFLLRLAHGAPQSVWL